MVRGRVLSNRSPTLVAHRHRHRHHHHHHHHLPLNVTLDLASFPLPFKQSFGKAFKLILKFVPLIYVAFELASGPTILGPSGITIHTSHPDLQFCMPTGVLLFKKRDLADSLAVVWTAQKQLKVTHCQRKFRRNFRGTETN